MKTFKISPHTADVRLELSASNLEKLFCVAIEGMAEIIKPGCCSSPKTQITQELAVQSMDTTTLLIDFMSDVLAQTHINKAIFCKAIFHELTEKSLRATIFGQPVESFDEDIKAVTYHEAEVVKNAQGNYETMIVFDI